MEKKLCKKINALNPEIKDKIEDLFKNMNESISLLYDIATKDEKTGLYNNRFFNHVLEIEIEKRGKQKLSLVILDIDFFKRINEKYRHIKADEILIKLTKIIKKQIRKSDIAARFGGEEFIILFPETNLTKAKKVTKRLKDEIQNNKFLKKYDLKISGGLTEDKKRDSALRFKNRADKALLNAKKQRDKIFVK